MMPPSPRHSVIIFKSRGFGLSGCKEISIFLINLQVEKPRPFFLDKCNFICSIFNEIFHRYQSKKSFSKNPKRMQLKPVDIVENLSPEDFKQKY